MVMMPAGETPDLPTRAPLQSYQQKHLGASRRNRGRSENFAYQYLRHVNGSLTCRKILRHWASGFISRPNKVVLQFLSLLTIHCLGRV
jgi:hypothetical protein